MELSPIDSPEGSGSDWLDLISGNESYEHDRHITYVSPNLSYRGELDKLDSDSHKDKSSSSWLWWLAGLGLLALLAFLVYSWWNRSSLRVTGNITKDTQALLPLNSVIALKSRASGGFLTLNLRPGASNLELLTSYTLTANGSDQRDPASQWRVVKNDNYEGAIRLQNMRFPSIYLRQVTKVRNGQQVRTFEPGIGQRFSDMYVVPVAEVVPFASNYVNPNDLVFIGADAAYYARITRVDSTVDYLLTSDRQGQIVDMQNTDAHDIGSQWQVIVIQE